MSQPGEVVQGDREEEEGEPQQARAHEVVARRAIMCQYLGGPLVVPAAPERNLTAVLRRSRLRERARVRRGNAGEGVARVRWLVRRASCWATHKCTPRVAHPSTIPSQDTTTPLRFRPSAAVSAAATGTSRPTLFNTGSTVLQHTVVQPSRSATMLGASVGAPPRAPHTLLHARRHKGGSRKSVEVASWCR